MAVKNEFELLKTRRFCPLFITQFFGAFNDNLYKTALIMLLAFGNSTAFNPDTLINLAAGLFILPFFLFSAFAGQLADKLEKSRLISYIKLIEVTLAVLVWIGFYFHHFILLLVALFLLGTHSTFFGPLKYSILPQHLKDEELLGGNGLIEMGTFIAILLGTIFGGLLMAIPNYGQHLVAIMMISFALLGFTSSLFIPKATSFASDIQLDWNFVRQTWIILKETIQNKLVFYAIIGISWFWLFGSIIITQIANFTRLTLGGSETVATLLLVSFSLGIGIGSISCEWLTKKKIDIGFVLFALVGLTLFTLDISFAKVFIAHAGAELQVLATSPLAASPFTTPPMDAISFISRIEHWRILIDGFLMGAFGGIYLVPLYTLIQKASLAKLRSRMIAANNIMNALFMVFAAGFAILILNLGFTIPELFIITAILNLLAAISIIKLMHLMPNQVKINR